jgi:hypothetical protein
MSRETASTRKHLSPREIFRKTASQWSGQIFLLPKRGNYTLESADFDQKRWYPSSFKGHVIPAHPMTMHGVAWDYDLRIPIVFFDPSTQWIRPGQYSEVAVQQDIAPTLAKILDIPPPARNGGKVLGTALAQRHARGAQIKKPKAMVIFVQDQMGRQYLQAHPGRAKFYERMVTTGANFVNGSVAHVDVETSVGHAAVGTGAWPSEHGVAGNNFFHGGIWRQLAALGVQLGPETSTKFANPSFFFSPALSDVWSVSRKSKPIILSVAPAPRAAIAMGGHGALFNGGVKTYVTWTDEAKGDGAWTTEEQNYQMPRAFEGQGLMPSVKELVGHDGKWRGHQIIKQTDRGEPYLDRAAIATPAAVKHQASMTLKAIEDLKIGVDEETDLVWVNTKATDYCGHFFGYESDECGDVLQAADEEAKKIVELVEKQTGGDLIVVLTADHGAAPLPELSGAYRLDRVKLRQDMNARFDKRDNNIDLVQLITSSQVYVNEGELAANGLKMSDLVGYLRSVKASMSSAFNSKAADWLKKGKPREAIFFEDVVAKADLK